MTVPKRNVRGLQDIRSYWGKVADTVQPHKVYMKIASLALEEYRRGKERDSAMFRVKSIEARSREIEAERTALLQSLAEQAKQSSSSGGQPSSARGRD
jgi:hypothetical protein